MFSRNLILGHGKSLVSSVRRRQFSIAPARLAEDDKPAPSSPYWNDEGISYLILSIPLCLIVGT